VAEVVGVVGVSGTPVPEHAPLSSATATIDHHARRMTERSTG